jgi:hypothetical protein
LKINSAVLDVLVEFTLLAFDKYATDLSCAIAVHHRYFENLADLSIMKACGFLIAEYNEFGLKNRLSTICYVSA